MTPQEVAALSNGELDDLLATKGMGWVKDASRASWVTDTDGDEHEYRHERDWRPSICLDDVSEVTEKLGERGWRLTLTLYGGKNWGSDHSSRARAEAEACLLALESEGAK